MSQYWELPSILLCHNRLIAFRSSSSGTMGDSFILSSLVSCKGLNSIPKWFTGAFTDSLSHIPTPQCNLSVFTHQHLLLQICPWNILGRMHIWCLMFFPRTKKISKFPKKFYCSYRLQTLWVINKTNGEFTYITLVPLEMGGCSTLFTSMLFISKDFITFRWFTVSSDQPG